MRESHCVGRIDLAVAAVIAHDQARYHASQPSAAIYVLAGSRKRTTVGPKRSRGQPKDSLLRRSVAPASTCVARVELVRTETQLDVLPVRLRHTAGAVGRDLQVEGQRGGRVIVQP